MKRTVAIVSWWLATVSVFAQLDNEQAAIIAKPLVARFASESAHELPSVSRTERPTSAGGSSVDIYVSYGEVLVFLDGAGNFKGFSNMSASVQEPVTGGRDHFETEVAAWQLLESLLSELAVTGDFVRKRYGIDGVNDRPNVLSLEMRMMPFGYEADLGNVVFAKFHRVTGRVISINLGRGWTYEAPNIRISSENAASRVRLEYGGHLPDWHTTIKYLSIASPAAPGYTRLMRSQKKMRLHYIVTSPIGTAYVDSVTGDIVDYIAANDIASGRTSTSNGSAAANSIPEVRSSNDGVKAQISSVSVSWPKTVALAMAVIVGVLLLCRLWPR